MSSSMEKAKPNPKLPEEIIEEILSRLPVKSILRLRSVCKLWLSLISNPQFIKSHLSKSIGNPHFSGHRMILSHKPPNYYLTNCSVSSLLNRSVDAIELDCSFKNVYDGVWTHGSCNGLFFLVIKKKLIFRDLANATETFVLWNPTTRKLRRLPNSEMIPGPDYKYYGFGYDECNDDFKVVVINDNGLDYKVCIYSSKSNSWKSIEDFSLGDLLDNTGRFVSGALHWTASLDIRYESPSSWVIVSLDLETETYGEVSQPKYGEGKYNLTLGILENCLSVICNYEKTRVDVWVMKEYGVKESWTKLVSIPYMVGPWSYDCIELLLTTVNGDIMLQLDSHILLYDLKHKTFRTLFRSYFEDLDVITYVESLVSPMFKPELGDNRK